MGTLRRVLITWLALAILMGSAPALALDVPDGEKPPKGVSSAADGWVVALDAPAGLSSRRELKRAGIAVEQVSADGMRMVVRSSRPGSVVKARIRRLKGVRWVEPLVPVKAAEVPSDPSYRSQWGLPAVKAPAAWDVTKGSASVVIAVVDSGVDLRQSEFSGRLLQGYDFVNSDATPQDDDGHGTHVASIASAAMNNGVGGAGMAPACSILPVKVLDEWGDGTSFGVSEGIRYAANRGADVINLSLGTDSYMQVVAEAIEYAQRKDVLVVAAAGNDAAAVDYPARQPGVMAVSAVDSAMGLASFSSRGPQVDIAAPGVGILATVLGGRMEELDGTSMASPFVAGAAALVRAKYPGLTQAQVAARLTSNATDLGSTGFDTFYGHGFLNVGRALGQNPDTADNEIPGVEIPPAPVAESLSAVNDPHDVYSVFLRAGERFTATLTAGADTSFGLNLYGPSATRLSGSVPVTQAVGAGYPVSLDFTAGSTGSYYLDVRALSGAGSYGLAYQTSYLSDDEVPGFPIPQSPVSGALDEGTDDDDVFAVTLAVGDRLTASLTAPEDTDFDLYLFAPDATTVDGSVDPVELAKSVSYPENLSYTATVEGTYYLDVYAYSGAGAYSLVWSVVRGVGGGDDDVPGVALPPSPVNGALSSTTDEDDVYFVDLTAGQQITAVLTGADDTDFDLYLYPPGTRHVFAPDEPAAWSDEPAYPDRLVYVARQGGRYYLDAYAYSGEGSYRITYTISARDPDNDIPGVAPAGPEVVGTLDSDTDSDDVFAIPVVAGQQISASLTSSDSADFDLYLYGPDTRSVEETELVASYTLEYPEEITYIAPVSGTYYIDAFGYEGSGSYRLALAAGPVTAERTELALRADTPVGEVDDSITATLTVVGTGVPVADATVSFEALNGGVWRHVDFAKTNAAGVATVTGGIEDVAYYRATFSGNAGFASCVSGHAAPPVRHLADVRLVAATLNPAYGARTRLTAEAYDQETDAPVGGLLRIERYVGDKWVAVASGEATSGSFSATSIRSVNSVDYRAVFGGSATYDPQVSDPTTVKPRVSLTAPAYARSVRRRAPLAVAGTLLPRHIAGTKPVRLQCWRLESGRWVLRKVVSARVANVTGGSRYSAAVALPFSGTWRLRAYHPTDEIHALTFSPYGATIRVR